MTQRGDAITLPSGWLYWRVRTRSELEDLYEVGSDYEQYLYGPLADDVLDRPTVAIVTRTRGVKWLGLGKRPEGLVEGLVTLQGVPQYVMFKLPSRS